MSGQVIRFKIELKNRSDSDPVFHRFTGTYSYSELCTVVSHLWGERPKNSILNYIDDEGDAVRIGSEAEWQECVSIYQRGNATVLRLRGQPLAKESKRNKRPVVAPAAACSSSDSEADMEERLTDVSIIDEPKFEKVSTTDTSSTVPLVPEIQLPLYSDSDNQPRSEPTSVRARPQEEVASSTPGVTVSTSKVPSELPDQTDSDVKTTKEESPEPKVEVNSGATAVDLMSLVYNCDAGEELFKGAVEKFNNVVTRIVDPANPGEVHLDIDRSKLFRDTVFKSSEFMNKKKDLPQAEHLVRTAMEVFPDNVHLQYKLACVLSRRSQLEECLDMLLIAQANGFDETSKLQTDADLANVRKHPRFVEVLPSDDVIDYYDEVDPNPPAAPMEPRRMIKGDDADVRSLLTMFPDMTIDEATCVLVLAEGSLIRAINARISGDYARPGYAKANNSGYAYAPPSTTSCYTSRKERRVEKRRLEMAGKK